MNFGKWIFVSLVLFVVFIGSLVMLCMREDISLVSKDYYDEELAYQQQIEREQNTKGLTQKPMITYHEQSGITVTIPGGSTLEKGEMKLFCPSNARLDQHFELKPIQEQVFKLKMAKGMYRIKLSWSMSGKNYYFEDQITI